MDKDTIAFIAIVSALALLLALEGMTVWNTMNPSASASRFRAPVSRSHTSA